MKLTNLRGWVTLMFVVLAAVGLTACGETSTKSWDLSTSEKARQVPCTEVSAATKAVNDLLDEDTAPGKRNRLEEDLKLDPDNEGQISQVLSALNEHAEECKTEGTASASPSATPTAEASDTPSASPTSSATPSSTPSSTTDSLPASIVGWDSLLASPPNELEESIESFGADIGFTWEDAAVWAETKLPSGSFVDARIVLVFKQPKLSDADARQKAGIDEPVAVVHVKTCHSVYGEGCPSGKAVRVILAPLNLKDGEVTSLRVGTGVVLTEGFPLITYTR